VSARPTRTDALLGVAVTCLVAVAVAADAPTGTRAVLSYASAVGFGALVLVSRARPVLALLATAVGIVAHYASDLSPIGLAAPLAAVLFLAADRGRVVAAAVIGAALLGVSVLARLAEGDDLGVVLGFDLGSEAVLMLAVVALGDAVRSRRALRGELVRQAAAAAEDRRREAARQVEAERVRFARELHDTLGHTMSLVAVQAAVADEALAADEPAAARPAVAAIAAASGSAMAELRATLGVLRSESGDREPPPGLDRLARLADGVTRSGLPVDLRVHGDLTAVPAVVGITAYRVVQEALTNAIRHAGATRVTVEMTVTGERMDLTITDDGGGVPTSATAPGHGDGLRGMHERVCLLGGELRAGRVDGGFRVVARLPLRGRAE
jgi:signal transduction histidine kinase